MRRSLKFESKEKLTGSAFISFWFIGFLVFMVFPLGYSLYMSLNKVQVVTDKLEMQWLGFGNFAKALFEDVEPLEKIAESMLETLIIVPIIVVFALLLALMLNQEFKGRGFFRAVFFLPVVLTSGNLIAMLTNQDQGTFSFLTSSSLETYLRNFDGPLKGALEDILGSFVVILWYSGVQMLLLIAGMQSINPSIYEAAKIDGAGKWESLWTITLPGVMPFLFICIIYTIVDQFTMPTNAMMDLVTFHMGSIQTGYGYANAIAWIYFLVILLLIGIVAWCFRKTLGFRREGK